MRKKDVIRYYIEAAILPTMYGLVWLVLGYGGLWFDAAIGWGFVFMGLFVFGPAWVAWHYFENKREQADPRNRVHLDNGQQSNTRAVEVE